MTTRTRTCLMFPGGGAPEAVETYVSLVPDSRIEGELRPDPAGPPLVIEFVLGGAPFMALNAGPDAAPTEAVSISVSTADQAETDRLWDALVAGGGRESRCGWVRDRWGFWWQIVPEVLPRLLKGPDREAAGRVMQAMLGMGRIDVAAIEAAAAG